MVYLNDLPGPGGGDQWFTANDDNRPVDAEPARWCYITTPELEGEGETA